MDTMTQAEIEQAVKNEMIVLINHLTKELQKTTKSVLQNANDIYVTALCDAEEDADTPDYIVFESAQAKTAEIGRIVRLALGNLGDDLLRDLRTGVL